MSAISISRVFGHKRNRNFALFFSLLFMLTVFASFNFRVPIHIERLDLAPWSESTSGDTLDGVTAIDLATIMQALNVDAAQPSSLAAVKSDLTIITLVCPDDMSKLRELTGSIHRLRDNNIDVPLIIIYGFGLSRKEKHEIGLWRNVELIDGFETLFLGQVTLESNSNDFGFPDAAQVKSYAPTILNAIELAMRRYKLVLYVRVDAHFTLDTLELLKHAVLRDGFLFAGNEESHAAIRLTHPYDYTKLAAIGFQFRSQASLIFVDLELQCLRGYHCDALVRKQLQEAQLGYLQKNLMTFEHIGLKAQEDYNFCYVLIRDDIIYSHVPGNARQSLKAIEPRSRTVVAFGMATISTHASTYLDVAPLRIFVPNFLSTVSDHEWSRFEYVIYMGFDEEDKFFDSAQFRSQINLELTKLVNAHASLVEQRIDQSLRGNHTEYVKVTFEYVRFPFSQGWVTYIWNGLYAQAMREECDYFYQVNDDLQLITAGWTSAFVDNLKAIQDVGLVGPKDKNRPDELLTQAMVSKRHYQIFGRLYPLDIKDWYSDNWLNMVYANRRLALSAYEGRNLNDKGTRYRHCDTPRLKETLEIGKKTIEDWLLDERDGCKDEASYGGGAILTLERISLPWPASPKMKIALKYRNVPTAVEGKRLKILNATTVELKSKTFTFDALYNASPPAASVDFPSERTQPGPDLFQEEILPLLQNAIHAASTASEQGEGMKNQAVIAYGCTSSGKTHTLYNSTDGIVLKSFEHLLQASQAPESSSKSAATTGSDGERFRILLSCVENHMELVSDFLSNDDDVPPHIRAHLLPRTLNSAAATFAHVSFPKTPGPATSRDNWKERRKIYLHSVKTAREVVSWLLEKRKSGATNANQTSSRSHFLVFLELVGICQCPEDVVSCECGKNGGGGSGGETLAQLTFADLAGSERHKNTGLDPARMKESGFINKSLHSLRQVLAALRESQTLPNPNLRRQHIPFRDSKLTQILHPAFTNGGSILLLICVNGEERYVDETVEVLETGCLASKVETKARIDSNISGAGTPMKSTGGAKGLFRRTQSNVDLTRDKNVQRLLNLTATSDSDVDVEEVDKFVDEETIRNDLTTDHALNLEKLRLYYETMFETSCAETELKFQRKVQIISRSYESELEQAKSTILELSRANEELNLLLQAKNKEFEDLKRTAGTVRESIVGVSPIRPFKNDDDKENSEWSPVVKAVEEFENQNKTPAGKPGKSGGGGRESIFTMFGIRSPLFKVKQVDAKPQKPPRNEAAGIGTGKKTKRKLMPKNRVETDSDSD